MLKRAGRRLLVSPWFAAGAGVVIATGAIIYTPHASLDFGKAIHVIHCKNDQCNSQVTAQGGAAGMPAGTGAGRVTPSPSTGSVLRGITFTYRVLSRSQDEFSMLITIHSRQSLGQWDLRFVIPGAKDVYVVPGEARWQPSGTDGGTASNYIMGTESAGYAQISAHQSALETGSSRSSETVQFTVRGTGVPRAPAHCSFDGAPCQFELARAPAPAVWPGSE